MSDPVLFKPVIPPQQWRVPMDWPEVFGNANDLVVEIGFGNGEVLLREAAAHPGRNYIGIEQHSERIEKTLKRIARLAQDGKADGSNIRILKIDARVAFDRLFPPQIVAGIFSLFPCPWPKDRHEKNRLFSAEFLNLLNSRLRMNGALKIVTDHEPYARWIADQLKEEAGFSFSQRKIRAEHDTKFEKKWRAQGQEEFFELMFVKMRHNILPAPKDVDLKAYRLEDFDPEKFVLEQHVGEVCVIPRGFVYDPLKKIALVQVLVVEGHLQQPFWATIAYRENGWRVFKTEGQSFFATPGIAFALEYIYHAVEKTNSERE